MKTRGVAPGLAYPEECRPPRGRACPERSEGGAAVRAVVNPGAWPRG